MLKIKPATDVIENEDSRIKTLRGPGATEAFRLRSLIVGLRIEESGMKVSRGINCRKLAKETTGLKTNDRAKLTARLQVMLDEQLSKCLIITDGE